MNTASISIPGAYVNTATLGSGLVRALRRSGNAARHAASCSYPASAIMPTRGKWARQPMSANHSPPTYSSGSSIAAIAAASRRAVASSSRAPASSAGDGASTPGPDPPHAAAATTHASTSSSSRAYTAMMST